MWYNHKLKSNNIFSLHLEYMCTRLNNNIHDIIIYKKLPVFQHLNTCVHILIIFKKKKKNTIYFLR